MAKKTSAKNEKIKKDDLSQMKNKSEKNSKKIFTFKTLKEDLIEAFKKCKEHKLLWVLCMVLDVAFFLSAMKITEYYLVLIKEDVLRLMDVVEQATGTLSLDTTDMASLLAVKQTAEAHYTAILVNIGWMILYLVIAYLILQGIAWYISSIMKGEKFGKNILSFLGKFTALTLVQVIMGLAILYFSSISQNLSAGAVTLISSDTTLMIKQIFFGVIFLVFDYFAVLSYGFIPSKNWIKNIFLEGYRQARYLVPAYVTLVLLFLLSCVLGYYLSLYSPVAALCFAILVMLPLFTYLRVFVFCIVKRTS